MRAGDGPARDERVGVVAFCADERASLAAILAGQPYTVESLASVDAFLAAVDTRAFACVVLPADLPDGGARRLIDAVRARIAVVVIGRDDDLRAAVDFVKCGATEFVEPPLRAARLVRAVQRALAAIYPPR